MCLPASSSGEWPKIAFIPWLATWMMPSLSITTMPSRRRLEDAAVPLLGVLELARARAHLALEVLRRREQPLAHLLLCAHELVELRCRRREGDGFPEVEVADARALGHEAVHTAGDATREHARHHGRNQQHHEEHRDRGHPRAGRGR
jgi:hypothetical protein